MNENPETVYCIMGPTASGKSDLAVGLALRIGGEVVSADSMQLYRGLEIGTAQPSMSERRGVAHHLLGVCGLHERVDVFRFVAMAEAAIADIRSRGKIPVLAGGTGFYLKSLFYGLDELPGDEKLRAELDAAYDSTEGEDALKTRMRELDPEGLAKWSRCRRKLIRALEVRLLAGKSILELQQGQRKLRFPVRAYRLDWEPDELRRRIAARTRRMLDAGWIEEAKQALAAGILDSPTAHQAIGYDTIGQYLAGAISFDTMEERIVTASCQLARRQRTWFRHQHPEAAPLAMPEGAKELS